MFVNRNSLQRCCDERGGWAGAKSADGAKKKKEGKKGKKKREEIRRFSRATFNERVISFRVFRTGRQGEMGERANAIIYESRHGVATLKEITRRTRVIESSSILLQTKTLSMFDGQLLKKFSSSFDEKQHQERAQTVFEIV